MVNKSKGEARKWKKRRVSISGKSKDIKKGKKTNLSWGGKKQW